MLLVNLLISHLVNLFSIYRQWEKELSAARKKNRKPRLRNALLSTFWKSCIVDGLLVFIFVLLKSIMPVFLAQLLIQFQLPPGSEIQTSNGNTTEAIEITTIETSTDANDDVWFKIFQFLIFVW